VALERGDIALAERRFGAALASFERAGTLDRLEAARAAVGMGRTLVAAGRTAEAEPWFEQALRVREANLPADHDDIAEVRTELGKIAPPARTGG
jgi:tetratricopeptide (TPR) repeat protein